MVELREHARRLTAHDEGADDAIGAQQRHDKQRRDSPLAGRCRWTGLRGSLTRSGTCSGSRALRRDRRSQSRRGRMVCSRPPDELVAHAVGGAEPELLPQLAEHIDCAGVGHGELHRLGDDRRQHRLEVERRVDRVADLAERLQLRYRARELVGPGAQLAEQARVLDGDDGLVGEGPQRRELLLGQRPGRDAHHAEGTDRGVAAQHRHDRDGAVAGSLEVPDPDGKLLRRLLDVRDVDDPAVEDGKPMHVVARERKREHPTPRLGAGGVRVHHGRRSHHVAVGQGDADRRIGEQLQSALHDSVEHGLGIGQRAADDLQDLGGRGLLLQRFGQLRGPRLHLFEQPHVLDRDDGLVGEGLDELDLLLGERPASLRQG